MSKEEKKQKKYKKNIQKYKLQTMKVVFRQVIDEKRITKKM